MRRKRGRRRVRSEGPGPRGGPLSGCYVQPGVAEGHQTPPSDFNEWPDCFPAPRRRADFPFRRPASDFCDPCRPRARWPRGAERRDVSAAFERQELSVQTLARGPHPWRVPNERFAVSLSRTWDECKGIGAPNPVRLGNASTCPQVGPRGTSRSVEGELPSSGRNGRGGSREERRITPQPVTPRRRRRRCAPACPAGLRGAATPGGVRTRSRPGPSTCRRPDRRRGRRGG